MNLPCQDKYFRTFDKLDEFGEYHTDLDKQSEWKRLSVSSLQILPLDEELAAEPERFPYSSEDAIKDTMKNVGLAAVINSENGACMPIRDKAFKSLLDRAKINGTVLARLPRATLADILNKCLSQHDKAEALLLCRDEKINAFHSGDEKDYSILPIPELIGALTDMINIRFPGYRFDSGYMDHSMSSATFTFPGQKTDLLGEYEKHLLASGVSGGIASLTPGIRFTSSDAGVSCASVSAMFVGGSWPINIGTVVSVKHRGQTTVSRFRDEAEGVFAKFQDTVKALSNLLDVYVQYPVSAMELICRKVATPKKETAEAISIFEMTYGGGACSAHEIYMAMQEILFFMKANGAEPAKLFKAEESITRALTFRWEDFDVARAA